METCRRSFNIQYSAVQGLYWMGFCVAFSFAAVFLQGRGYSNSSLGLVMSLGNVAGLILSPALASLMDRSRKIGVFHCLFALLVAQGLMLPVFILSPGRSVLLCAAYCLYMAFIIALNPIITQLSFELEHSCGYINYGAARGIGSLAYAPTAMLMGLVTQRLGHNILPMAGLVCVVAQLALIFALFLQTRHKPSPLSYSDFQPEQPSSLGVFIKENPRFCFLLLGIAMLFFAHNLVNNFMINVVRNVGGDTAAMGGVNGFMALMELPAMFLYDKLTRRISCPATLRIAAAVFVVKALCIALAPSMPALFAAHLLQSFSFALITPACVRYVNLYIHHSDSAKGQALAYGMTTLGSIFASSLGGLMYDNFTVTATLLVGSAVSAIGAVVCFIFSKNAKQAV